VHTFFSSKSSPHTCNCRPFLPVPAPHTPQDPGHKEEEARFLRGWDSLDPELSAANRQREYGFLDMYAALETLNDRED